MPAKTATKTAPKKKGTEKLIAKKAMKAPAPMKKTAGVTKETAETAKQALKTAVREKTVAPKAAVPKAELAATGPLAQKWTALFRKASAIESKPYNMKQIYAEKTAIVHKHLGWGYILANRNDRLEVLFKDGIKVLISNYK